MEISIQKSKAGYPHKIISAFVAFAFLFTIVIPPGGASAQVIQTILNLPAPGMMVTPTDAFVPLLVKGLTLYPENPLKFDFIVDTGNSGIKGEVLKEETRKLVKYFLAALTIPEDELWVNLSPYEKDRIIPEHLAQTEMGRDMLAQDYLLKQLSASMLYPEDELGQKFWQRVYKKVYEKFHTTDIPLNTFNKIWIVPDTAVVFEKGLSTFVVKSTMKVMLEEDYLALEKNSVNHQFGTDTIRKDEVEVISGVTSQIVREVLIPEIEKEVNTGATFANLRQIFNSMILAAWYKKNLRQTLLGRVYVDQNKTTGIDLEDKKIKEKIYGQYLAALKKGVYDYIREDYDPATRENVPRHYFSGGVEAKFIARVQAIKDFSRLATDEREALEEVGSVYNSSVELTEAQASGEAVWQSQENSTDLLLAAAFNKSVSWINASRVTYEDYVKGRENAQAVAEVIEFLEELERQDLKSGKILKDYLIALLKGELPQFEGQHPQLNLIDIPDRAAVEAIMKAKIRDGHASDRGIHLFTHDAKTLIHELAAFLGLRHPQSVVYELVLEKWSELKAKQGTEGSEPVKIAVLMVDTELTSKFSARLSHDGEAGNWRAGLAQTFKSTNDDVGQIFTKMFRPENLLTLMKDRPVNARDLALFEKRKERKRQREEDKRRAEAQRPEEARQTEEQTNFEKIQKALRVIEFSSRGYSMGDEDINARIILEDMVQWGSSEAIRFRIESLEEDGKQEELNPAAQKELEVLTNLKNRIKGNNTSKYAIGRLKELKEEDRENRRREAEMRRNQRLWEIKQAVVDKYEKEFEKLYEDILALYQRGRRGFYKGSHGIGAGIRLREDIKRMWASKMRALKISEEPTERNLVEAAIIYLLVEDFAVIQHPEESHSESTGEETEVSVVDTDGFHGYETMMLPVYRKVVDKPAWVSVDYPFNSRILRYSPLNLGVEHALRDRADELVQERAAQIVKALEEAERERTVDAGEKENSEKPPAKDARSKSPYEDWDLMSQKRARRRQGRTERDDSDEIRELQMWASTFVLVDGVRGSSRARAEHELKAAPVQLAVKAIEAEIEHLKSSPMSKNAPERVRRMIEDLTQLKASIQGEGSSFYFIPFASGLGILGALSDRVGESAPEAAHKLIGALDEAGRALTVHAGQVVDLNVVLAKVEEASRQVKDQTGLFVLTVGLVAAGIGLYIAGRSKDWQDEDMADAHWEWEQKNRLAREEAERQRQARMDSEISSLTDLINQGVKSSEDVVRVNYTSSLQEEIEPDKQPLTVLIKPEMSQSSFAIAQTLHFFTEQGYAIDNVMVWRGSALRERGMIPKHYGKIAYYSANGRKALEDLQARQAFLTRHGLGEEDLNTVEIIGGQELVNAGRITAQELNDKWYEAGSDGKDGIYSAKIEVGGKEVYVINGFSPVQVEHFTADNAVTISFQIRPLSVNADIEDIRDALGATNILKAAPQTLRGQIRQAFDSEPSLAGMKTGVTVNPFQNGIHLSDSLLSALVESLNWGGALDDQPLAQLMRKEGLMSQEILSINQAEHPDLFEEAAQGDSESDVAEIVKEYWSKHKASASQLGVATVGTQSSRINLQAIEPATAESVLNEAEGQAGVIVGGVFVRDTAPTLMDEERLAEASQQNRKVIVDVAIDQGSVEKGGNIAPAFPGEARHKFTQAQPGQIDRHGNFRMSIPNMPAAFGEVASPFLSEATQPIARALVSNKSTLEILSHRPEIRGGVIVTNNRVTNEKVARVHGFGFEGRATDEELNKVLQPSAQGKVVGVLAEIKEGERRVAKVVKDVEDLIKSGAQKVLVQQGAGEKSGITDEAFKALGDKVQIVATAEEVWKNSDIIIKVKEPLASEYQYFRPGLAIYAYFHADGPDTKALVQELVAKGVTALAYEKVVVAGDTPLLKPMSRIAGWISGLWAALYARSGRTGYEQDVNSQTGVVTPERVAEVNARFAILYDYIKEHFEELKSGTFRFSEEFLHKAGLPNEAAPNAVFLGGGDVGREAAYMSMLLGARNVAVSDVAYAALRPVLERTGGLKEIYGALEEFAQDNNLRIPLGKREPSSWTPESLLKYYLENLGAVRQGTTNQITRGVKQILEYGKELEKWDIAASAASAKTGIDALSKAQVGYIFLDVVKQALEKEKVKDEAGVSTEMAYKDFVPPGISPDIHKGKTVLVTGGLGYVSHALVRDLLANGSKVIIYDREVRDREDIEKLDGVTVIPGRLDDLDALREVFRTHKIDHVTHLAAVIEAGVSVNEPALFFENNVINTIRLLDVMNEFGVKGITFASSAGVYRGRRGLLVENDDVDPQNPYGETKRLMEKIMQDYAEKLGIHFASLRFFNVAGAIKWLGKWYGENHIGKESHIIPIIIENLQGKRRGFKVYGGDYDTPDRTNVRDYIHVEDLSNALLRAIAWTYAKDENLILNLGTGKGTSNLKVIEAVEEVTGMKVPHEIVDRRRGDADALEASGDRAKEKLGWVPVKSDILSIVRDAWAFHSQPEIAAKPIPEVVKHDLQVTESQYLRIIAESLREHKIVSQAVRFEILFRVFIDSLHDSSLDEDKQIPLYLKAKVLRGLKEDVLGSVAEDQEFLQDFKNFALPDAARGQQLAKVRSLTLQLLKQELQERATSEVGGIDFNPALLNLQIKRDQNGVPLPLEAQPIPDIKIDGFIPVIINMTPVTSIPLLLGIVDTEDKDNQLSGNELAPFDRIEIGAMES